MMGLKHQAAAARKWRTAIRQVEQHFPTYLPPMFFLTDPERVSAPVARVSTLPPHAGVIYRHFGAPGRVKEAEALAEICAKQNRAFLIAADPDLARYVNAAGVHWPESRLASARNWHGKFAIQTTSAHSQRALIRASRAGMDAAVLSTVFRSASPSAGAPLGAARLRRICKTSPIPIYGLGGINAQTANRVARYCGLSGVSL